MNDMRSLRALKDEYKTEFAEYVLKHPQFLEAVHGAAYDFVTTRIRLCADLDSRLAMVNLLKDVIKKGDF